MGRAAASGLHSSWLFAKHVTGRVCSVATLPIRRWWFNTTYDATVNTAAATAAEEGKDALFALFAEMQEDGDLTEEDIAKLAHPNGPRVGPKLHRAVTYVTAKWGIPPYNEANRLLYGHRIRQYLMNQKDMRMIDIATYSELLTAACFIPSRQGVLARAGIQHPEIQYAPRVVESDLSRATASQVLFGVIPAAQAIKSQRYMVRST